MDSFTRYQWQHGNDPAATTTAQVTFLPHGLVARGEQQAGTYRARWELDAAHDWVTRFLEVHVEGRDWRRTLRLERSPDGMWRDATTVEGDGPQLAAPGIEDPGALRDAVDCDLGLCPLTNTMPIRRLGLLRGHRARTAMTMAWVDMPSLRVIASDQYYASHSPRTVRYASGTRRVDVVLSVDDDGVVIDYPDLAHRAPPADA